MYYHRCLCHRHVTFSRPLALFTKFLVWTRMSYSTKNERIYVASHCKHHQYTDSELDPHTPTRHPILWFITQKREHLTWDEINRYCKNFQFYDSKFDLILEKYPYGPWFMLGVLCLSFGWYGLIAWILLSLGHFLPLFFNFFAHAFAGYIFEVPGKPIKTEARNIPFGFLLSSAGEEYHANHHQWPNSPNFGIFWWEPDLGYWFLKFLSIFKLVTVHETKLKIDRKSLKVRFVKYKESLT